MRTKILIPVAAVLMLLAACKGKGGASADYEIVGKSKSASSADSTAVISDTNKVAEKLVKTADITFKVKNVQKAGEDIATMVAGYKGMVMHHRVQSTAGASRDVHVSNDSIMRVSDFNTNGEMVVRLPSASLEEFMTKVSHLGIYVNRSQMDIDDRSLDYLSEQLKLKDRQELVAAQKAGQIKIKNPTNVLLLKDDMVDQKIQNLRTDLAVKYSVVSLNFYQTDNVVKEIIPNDDPSAYNIPFFQRLALSLVSGWSIFVDLFMGLMNLWVFILCGLGIWWAIVVYKKRNTTARVPVS